MGRRCVAIRGHLFAAARQGKDGDDRSHRTYASGHRSPRFVKSSRQQPFKFGHRGRGTAFHARTVDTRHRFHLHGEPPLPRRHRDRPREVQWPLPPSRKSPTHLRRDLPRLRCAEGLTGWSCLTIRTEQRPIDGRPWGADARSLPTPTAAHGATAWPVAQRPGWCPGARHVRNRGTGSGGS